MFCFFKQKTAYELRISDWSSDVCSSDLPIATSECVTEISELLRLKVTRTNMSRSGAKLTRKSFSEMPYIETERYMTLTIGQIRRINWKKIQMKDGHEQ